MLRRTALGALALHLAWSSPTVANPCASIAAHLRDYAEAQPERRADAGETEFLNAALDLTNPRDSRDGAAMAGWPGSGCDGALAAIPDLSIDDTVRNQLDRALCALNVVLYDARPWGGFVALAKQADDPECAALQVLLVANGIASIGPSLTSDRGRICDSASAHIIRTGERAFPAVLRRNVEGPLQSYELSLFSPDAAKLDIDDPLCRITVAYRPRFEIERWLSADPEGVIPPSLRDVVAPILLARASGRDLTPLLQRWRDRPSGASDYDSMLRFADPIIRLTSSEMNRYRLGASLSIVPGHSRYRDWGGDFTPLRVEGRRYILRFGMVEWSRRSGWRDPGFEVWEWNGHAFDPVIAGNLVRRASLDLEIDVSP